MALLKPFRAVRPAKGLEEQIAALPYDVYNRSEAKEEVSDKPLSFLNIDRAETGLPDEVDTYADEVYERAARLLQEFLLKGYFVREEKPCYYLYELTMNGRSQTGLVACASIDDYLSNIIKKHENTRADKEEDRIRHVDTCNAQTGPIFLAYRRNHEITEIVQATKEKEAMYDFTSSDGIRHRVFVIDNEQDISKITAVFQEIDQIYIADGHHRCASAVKVGFKRREQHPNYTGMEEFNSFLSVLFPDEELLIMDYNRVVKDLNQLSSEEFLKRVEEFFTIEGELDSAQSPKQKGYVTMYLEEKWYLLKIREEYCSKDPVKGLDVSILQDTVLSKVLGIGDPKTDKRIDFVGGIRGLNELEKRCHEDCKVAFAMYPTSIQELFDVADANRLMPPKSTWFEPKLRSGLFIHELDD